MKQKNKNKLQAVEMRLWGKMIKTSWMEQKSNERVLDKIGERSLMINIMERKIKFIEYVTYITI